MTTAIVMIGGLSLLLVAISAVVRWPILTLYLVAAFVVTEFYIPVLPPVVTFGGISVTPADITALVLLSSVAFKTSKDPVSYGGRLRNSLLLLLVALVAIACVRGMVLFGGPQAINEARSWFYIASLFIATAVYLRRHAFGAKAIETFLLVTSAALSVMSLINIGRFGLGSASSGVRNAAGEVLQAGRPMTSGQAIVIAIALVVVLYRYQIANQKRWLFSGAALAVVIVISQHRSVWVAAAIGVLIVLLTRPTKALFLIIVAVPLVSLGGITLVESTPALQRIAVNLGESATNLDTYEGRVFDWVTLIERNISAGPATLVFGEPFGAGWSRVRQDGLVVEYIPHNWYVAVGLRMGVLGLIVLIMALTRFAVAAWKVRFTSPALAILFVVLAYAWAYNVNWYLAPILAYLAHTLTSHSGAGRFTTHGRDLSSDLKVGVRHGSG